MFSLNSRYSIIHCTLAVSPQKKFTWAWKGIIRYIQEHPEETILLSNPKWSNSAFLLWLSVVSKPFRLVLVIMSILEQHNTHDFLSTISLSITGFFSHILFCADICFKKLYIFLSCLLPLKIKWFNDDCVVWIMDTSSRKKKFDLVYNNVGHSMTRVFKVQINSINVLFSCRQIHLS